MTLPLLGAITNIPKQSEKRFESRLMKNAQKSMRLNPIQSEACASPILRVILSLVEDYFQSEKKMQKLPSCHLPLKNRGKSF